MYAGVASTQSSSGNDDDDDENEENVTIIPGTSQPGQDDDENDFELDLPSFGGVRRVYFESMFE